MASEEDAPPSFFSRLTSRGLALEAAAAEGADAAAAKIGSYGMETD